MQNNNENKVNDYISADLFFNMFKSIYINRIESFKCDNKFIIDNFNRSMDLLSHYQNKFINSRFNGDIQFKEIEGTLTFQKFTNQFYLEYFFNLSNISIKNDFYYNAIIFDKFIYHYSKTELSEENILKLLEYNQLEHIFLLFCIFIDFNNKKI